MNIIIDFSDIIFDNSLVMAIIAINMTIIGLTSLAETKNIIGIDYGKFLINKYKMFNIIRIYYILIGFAIINISSLFLMFISSVQFRVINLIVLVLSLIFAIFYFFSYILIENKLVKKQIYKQEIQGLYCNSNIETTFEVDLLVKMSNGKGSGKKLSSDVITYFNKCDKDTQNAFKEIFGQKSIIYRKSKNIKKNCPGNYIYRQSENKDFVCDISHEFFQMFRYSELQDKWIIDILSLINGEEKKPKNYNELRLYNFARVIPKCLAP